jgi:molybdopterin synthase catalytic subunit
LAGLYRIVEGPVDLQEAIRAVAGPDRGAIATFIGTARDHHNGRPVRALEYHAYPEMAERVMRDIGRETETRFGTPHIAILHRIGRLHIGDPSVVVAVAAEHRREALAACAHVIERLKEVVPIWKKEQYADGAAWIEGSGSTPALS